ncbi:MAG: hypothetical protein LBO79_01975, partial [Zoogloeaceae bacterium]|nr:hypothetical protein [Zoogloeaceae bacterium]
ANSKQQTANSKQQTANSKQQTANEHENLLRYPQITEKIFRRLDNAGFFLSSSPAFPSPSGFLFPSGFFGFLAFPRFTTPVAGACLGMRSRLFLFFLLFLSKGASP